MNFFAADRVAIGWHGKLPTVGDFVTRRLDIDFVNCWDMWMSRGLTELRSRRGIHWIDDYLQSPTWRFLLTPGFLPPPRHTDVWVGVVMPSVDRVGRYYPLTLASPLTTYPDTRESRTVLWSWLQSLENLAIDALEGDWSIDALEDALIRLGLPPDPSGAVVESTDGMSGRQWQVENAASKSIESFFAALSPAAQSPGASAGCVWFCQADAADPRIFLTPSLEDSISPLWWEGSDRYVAGF